jgi:hypothetical protein
VVDCDTTILTMPVVALEADPARIQSSRGVILGHAGQRAVWRFGFEPGSFEAERFRVWTLRPMWTLAMYQGTVLDAIIGPWGMVLPIRFARVIRGG